MKIAELYQTVTQGIIRELEQGAAPWIKPWKAGKVVGVMPANAITRRGYHGINIPILWDAASRNGYERHAWLTFKQAADNGANIRKGERGTHVVFTKRLRVGDEDDEKLISMLRAYVVFNVAQVEGLPQGALPAPLSTEKRHEAADRFVEATATHFRDGMEAMFVPSRDFIVMPPMGSFTGRESFYATELHELGHWSGHTTRLNRNLSGRFGTRSYAAEELIAELTGAFLCAHLGITGELRHAGYIQSWIELLRDDNRAIFTAASKASQAADFLRSFSEPVATQPDDAGP